MSRENGNDLLTHTLITGADGMVGHYIDFGIRTNHRKLDVTDLKEVLAVCRKNMPKVIIHLAAETDVDRCERDVTYAYMINAIGTYNMAVAAKDVGAKLVYVSTSAVFDGEKEGPYLESDVPRPQNYYGHTKYLGELAAQGLLNDVIIARVCWMFGGGPEKDVKFISKVIKQVDQPVIKIVSGKRGSPTYAKDLIASIIKLIVENKKGIFHMSNVGSPTRVDVAREIVKIMNSSAKIEEVSPEFFGLDANRPNNESIASRISYMRPWQDALREYILNEWVAKEKNKYEK